jgi:hypothetical protein
VDRREKEEPGAAAGVITCPVGNMADEFSKLPTGLFVRALTEICNALTANTVDSAKPQKTDLFLIIEAAPM